MTLCRLCLEPLAEDQDGEDAHPECVHAEITYYEEDRRHDR